MSILIFNFSNSAPLTTALTANFSYFMNIVCFSSILFLGTNAQLKKREAKTNKIPLCSPVDKIPAFGNFRPARLKTNVTFLRSYSLIFPQTDPWQLISFLVNFAFKFFSI